MLDSTQILARELISDQIEKLIEKYQKKAEKEKAKKKNAYVTYQGEKYYSESELQEAYACDVFTSSVYDRLVDRLNRARGNIEEYELTPSEVLVIELSGIKNNLQFEIRIDAEEKKRKSEQDARAEQLANEGYSYKEINAIIGNEELMRYE